MILSSAQKMWRLIGMKFLNNGLERTWKDQSWPQPRNLSGVTGEKNRTFRQDSWSRAWTRNLQNMEWDIRSYRIIQVSVETRAATRNTLLFCPRRHFKLETVFLTVCLQRPIQNAKPYLKTKRLITNPRCKNVLSKAKSYPRLSIALVYKRFVLSALYISISHYLWNNTSKIHLKL